MRGLTLVSLVLLFLQSAARIGEGGGHSIRSFVLAEAADRRLGTDFDWELTLEDGYPQFPHDLDDVETYEDDLVFFYNHTGTLSEAKTLETRLLQYDCLGETDNVGMNISALYDSVGKSLLVDTDIDSSSIADSSAHYQQIDAVNATISFCVRVDYLYTGPNGMAESINFHETKVRIAVDLSAGFNLTAVDITKLDPSDLAIRKEVDAPVQAYFCDENYEDIGQPEFSQGDIVVGCMAVVPEKQNEVRLAY